MAKSKNPLLDYFPKDSPFGPISASGIKEPAVYRELFHTSNLIYQELASHPSLIVGRRGAGKTAFLNSFLLEDNGDVIVELPPHAAFRQIIESIRDLTQGSGVFVEEVAELWTVLLWTTVCSRIVKADQKRTKKIQAYLSGLGVKTRLSPYGVMKTVLHVLSERGGSKPSAVLAEITEELAFNDVTFAEARDQALDWLEENGVRAVILMDSLENFQLDDQTMCYAISGLLKCQGTFRSPGSQCVLRCCLPVELYHRFLDLSSNPNKDFQHQLLLHWHAGELIKLAARRYMTYLKLHETRLYEEMDHLDVDRRSDAAAFWNSLLPIRITNRVGSIESPLAYILRHTQLLPRQLLMYLNSIAAKSRKGRGRNGIQFTEESILEGIYEQENVICQEVFSAYESVHPGAKEGCESCIRYLPTRFSDGDLHKVYNRHGKGIREVYDYEDFKGLMIEIGAIGRVTGETDRYVQGLFEYTVPHRLLTSSNDDLCLHPVFTEVFHADKPPSGDGAPVVYPYGSDIDGPDNRELT